jgi:hypothetical protein
MFASYSPEEIADLIKKTQEAYMKQLGMPQPWFGLDWGIKNTCDHTFKEYVGATEAYKYCTKCDLKKIPE